MFHVLYEVGVLGMQVGEAPVTCVSGDNGGGGPGVTGGKDGQGIGFAVVPDKGRLPFPDFTLLMHDGATRFIFGVPACELKNVFSHSEAILSPNIVAISLPRVGIHGLIGATTFE
ncbi:hypothetical protein [Streptomyces eurocidicus]|uniref:Uncharacterized protein n=1 Tax=Streptomyces eurocidicus TaxID=66423 RepID=A0A7W8F4B1_STREU|nr:hypothetical protein [Streptomyces eurocidicus]MBB5120844.1 hypothetical protein [Streptomyces eurocidicus]